VTPAPAAEDFKWSWDGDLETSPTGEKAPPGDSSTDGGIVPVPEEPSPEVAPEEPAEAVEEPAAVAEPEPEQVVPDAGDGKLAEAYRRLLNDNLELRRKISEAENQGDSIRRENEKLTREIGDLERRIGESVRLIQTLKQEQQKTEGGADNAADLQAKLEKAEAEKRALGVELERIRSQAVTSAPPEAVASVPEETAAPAVDAGSDLFKQVEQDNRALKEKLAAADAGRQKAMSERESIARASEEATRKADEAEARRLEAEKKLAQAKAVEESQKKDISRLMKQIPDLEKELVDLRTRLAEKDKSSGRTSQEVETMKAELERREQRLVKAERMRELLEKTREEVRAADGREKRDMHFNMAIVYQREGRFRDAEQEYLSALQSDGSDADVHYNLGILYDDDLNDKQKAVLHYRRYLRLAPAAPDADQVKEWIMRLEME